MTMQREYVSLLFLGCVLIASCARAEEKETFKPQAKRTVLGAIVPLSGPLAFFGKDYVRAYELAVEAEPEIKARVDVRWEDSAYDPKQAVAAFNKLVSVDKADLVFSFGGPMLNALAPIAEAKKVPFFASESAKADCRGRSFCLLVRNEEDEWGQATWRVLRQQGRKRVGIVKNQNQFMNTFVDAIVRTKQADESVEVLLDVSPETVDLRSQVLSLRSKPVDALGVFLLPGSHHGFLAAMRAVDRRFPFFGVEEFLVRENNLGFEALTDGAFVLAPGSIESYRSKFESRFGFSAGFFYAPAFYDFLVLLKDALAGDSPPRGQALMAAMQFSGVRTGVSGRYSRKVSVGGVHSYSFPIFVYRVSGGKVAVEQVIEF